LSTTGMAPVRRLQCADWRSPGKTAERHTSAEFVAFLTDIVINQSRGQEIHVIADNVSVHKSAPVK